LTPNGELRLGEQSRELVLDSDEGPRPALAAASAAADVFDDRLSSENSFIQQSLLAAPAV